MHLKGRAVTAVIVSGLGLIGCTEAATGSDGEPAATVDPLGAVLDGRPDEATTKAATALEAGLPPWQAQYLYQLDWSKLRGVHFRTDPALRAALRIVAPFYEAEASPSTQALSPSLHLTDDGSSGSCESYEKACDKGSKEADEEFQKHGKQTVHTCQSVLWHPKECMAGALWKLIKEAVSSVGVDLPDKGTDSAPLTHTLDVSSLTDSCALPDDPAEPDMFSCLASGKKWTGETCLADQRSCSAAGQAGSLNGPNGLSYNCVTCTVKCPLDKTAICQVDDLYASCEQICRCE